MQDGALLGHVDLVAAKHRVNASAESDLVSQREQQPDRLVGHAMLGIVKVETGGFDGQAFAALGIFGEHGAQVAALDFVVVRLESLPCGAIG